MNSKKRGNESSLADEMSEDFFTAAEYTYELLQEFQEMGLHQGPALGGAMTQILSYLLAASPDTKTAMAVLSSCIANAASSNKTIVTTHPASPEIH